MTTKKKSPGFDFVVKQLEKDNDVDYATVRDAAAAEGFTIYPIMYGRAKAKLGLVEVAPRGSRKKAAEAKANNARRASSPANLSANGPMGSLEAVIQAMKTGEEARKRYRDALERIADIIDEALAD